MTDSSSIAASFWKEGPCEFELKSATVTIAEEGPDCTAIFNGVSDKGVEKC